MTKKPYLQKRNNLRLFLAEKRGELVKKAPDAYGVSDAEHYYFINSYNCIYECEYCYLQGYFSSPDIVLFLNHEEICNEISRVASNHALQPVWFHAGEFSDSLALSGINEDWEVYWETVKNLKNAFLELRTKSTNINSILKLGSLPNVVVSFSISPNQISREIDLKTPEARLRVEAMKKLVSEGHRVGIHLDPIVFYEGYIEDYRSLAKELAEAVPDEFLAYVSLGVVRFSKVAFREFEKNYPGSKIQSSEFITSEDGKVRYPRPIRLRGLDLIQQALIDAGVKQEKIYLCME